jgi:hypothetical protein
MSKSAEKVDSLSPDRQPELYRVQTKFEGKCKGVKKDLDSLRCTLRLTRLLELRPSANRLRRFLSK